MIKENVVQIKKYFNKFKKTKQLDNFINMLIVVVLSMCFYTFQEFSNGENILLPNGALFPRSNFALLIINLVALSYFSYVTFIGIQNTFRSYILNIMFFFFIYINLTFLPLHSQVEDVKHEKQQQERILEQEQRLNYLENSLDESKKEVEILLIQVKALKKKIQNKHTI